MARTAQIDLPLVMPAQAQKHVTVNEALVRLDAAAQLRVASSALAEPPASGVDGRAYLVPQGATGGWAGMTGKVAVWNNGGWLFLEPRPGWRAWDEEKGGHHLFDGTAWARNAIAASANGAASSLSVVEFDHKVTAGASNTTAYAIPNQAQVIGITGRVIEAMTGTGLTTWKIGVAGAANRYGSGLGKALNSYLVGLSGAPVTYYAATPILISADAGSFAAGRIRLAVHLLELQPPRSI